MPFPSYIHCGYNDHQSDDCVYYPICEICGSYDHDTHGHNRITFLKRGIKPRNTQHITKNCETCGSNVHTTSDHHDIEWFRKREALQAKKVESFKASKTESSSSLRLKTPTKSIYQILPAQIWDVPGPEGMYVKNFTHWSKGYGYGIVFKKGVKDGWLAGCRKVIGLDGCFLKHTCKGELLTAMGRDANNQMYPIAWAVVRVENSENWMWFLSLLQDDLSLNDGTGITIISDSHKGLLDAVHEFLPQAEHRKCTRHIFANFKKKFSGVQLQSLFWYAATSTLVPQFEAHMETIKVINPLAYNYLVERNPNTWSRAFFEMDRRCAAFENGISESFNKAILVPRGKPIITMLEEIRLYIMQRLFEMNKLASSLEDSITPSIRKRLELLKDKQRYWDVVPSGFQVLEVRKGDDSFGVNLQNKVCSCRMWELSGVPCVHAVAAYMHLNIDIDQGVSNWYSQEAWFSAYQFSINPVIGSKYWKRTNNEPPLPPICRRLPGRPKKQRIKCPTETTNTTHTTQISRGDEQDEEIFREFMEEEARKEEEYARRCREEEEWEAQMDWIHPMHWTEDGNEGNRE
ncbi:hypothetical protein Tco_1177155, partial [Tanacetum coccineum]